MSITLDLPPDVEREVVKAAAASGLSLESFVLELVEREVAAPTTPSVSEESFRAALDELVVEGAQAPSPEIRDDLYGDCD